MNTLQLTIYGEFLRQLADGKVLDNTAHEQLRLALKADRRPKAEDLVRIFARPIGDDIK